MILNKPVAINGMKYSLMQRIMIDLSRRWQLYLLLVIPIVYILVFAYVPMAGVQIAFKDFRIKAGIWGSPWVGFKHFESFFRTPNFSLLMQNTLLLSIYSLLAGFPIPIILALTINETANRTYKRLVQSITYAPYFISTVVLVGMLMNFFSLRTGFVNSLLKLMGIAQIDFMGKVEWFRSFYVWSGIWQSAGYSAVVYIAALASVDQALVEAAIIDGANRWQRMWHIDIPTILPTIVILFILAVGGLMGIGFEKVFLMQNPINLDISEIISTFVYKKGLKSFQYSYAAAVGLFNSVINLILISGANIVAKKLGETSLW